MKKLVLIILVILSCYHLRSQSSIGLNSTYIGAYGIQPELNFETKFYKRLMIGIRVGSNFKEYSAYKMGLRYDLWNNSSTKVLCGFDLGHLQYQKKDAQATSGYRTIEFLLGIRQRLSRKIEGLAEIGLLNKEVSSEPTPLILRVGIGYKLDSAD